MRELTTNYAGRATDLLFLQVDATRMGYGAQAAPLTFGDTVKVTAGLQKAAQAFVSTLFTRRGEAWNTDLGCDFLTAALQGRIRTPIDATVQFTRAVPAILAQINQGVTQNDERVVSAVLISAVVDRTSLVLRISLQTAAGVTAAFLVPLEAPQ